MILTNSGLITGGGHSYSGSDSIDEIVNTGQMIGIIRLYDGEDAVTNGGTITGEVNLGNGNDSFLSNSGTSGAVFGEDGDDTFTSGANADLFDGGNNDDTFRIAGSDGIGDTFAGGTGTDKIQVLGTAAATLAAFSAGASGIEAWVGNGNGLLGTSGANIFDFTALTAISGLLFIDGQGGDDTITGSSLADTLRGGLGKDTLTGGLGPDLFDFDAIGESVKGTGRDVITDFNRSLNDRIDFTDIDAKKGVAGNNAFKFIGTKAFHDVKGELRCSGGIVKGDVDGDGVADFEIQVNLARLKGRDFVR